MSDRECGCNKRQSIVYIALSHNHVTSLRPPTDYVPYTIGVYHLFGAGPRVATVPLRKGLMVPRRTASGHDADHATWYYYQTVGALQAPPAHVQFGGGHEQKGVPFY